MVGLATLYKGFISQLKANNYRTIGAMQRKKKNCDKKQMNVYNFHPSMIADMDKRQFGQACLVPPQLNKEKPASSLFEQ